MTMKDVVIRKEEGAVAKREEQQFSLSVSQQCIDHVQQSLTLMRNMVKNSLVENVDFGSLPGIPEFLWEPGAGNIISSFNCRVGPARTISFTDDGTKISVVVEVPILSLVNGAEVSCGVGAASTMETKNKYRWVEEDDLFEWGYSKESAITDKLKTKSGYKNKKMYRVPNPEHGELLNVIWKIARKRGKVSAAKDLPGVGTALGELFAAKKAAHKEERNKGDYKRKDEPSIWTPFEAELTKRGLNHDQAKVLLNVDSIGKEWVGKGKTLDEAIAEIDRKLKETQDKFSGQQQPPKQPVQKSFTQRDPNSIKTYGELYAACQQDFGLKDRSSVLKELGVNRQEALSVTPAVAYQQILKVRQ